MQSTLKSMVGVDLPVIQAPMAGVQDSALALAVSNAGGLGMLACAMFSHEQCRDQLQSMRDGTDRPYGVNFFAHSQQALDGVQAEQWRAQFKPYYREFDVIEPEIPATPARMP